MNLVGRKFNNPRLDIDIKGYKIDGENWFMGKESVSLLGTLKIINHYVNGEKEELM